MFSIVHIHCYHGHGYHGAACLTRITLVHIMGVITCCKWCILRSAWCLYTYTSLSTGAHNHNIALVLMESWHKLHTYILINVTSLSVIRILSYSDNLIFPLGSKTLNWIVVWHTSSQRFKFDLSSYTCSWCT